MPSAQQETDDGVELAMGRRSRSAFAASRDPRVEYPQPEFTSRSRQSSVCRRRTGSRRLHTANGPRYRFDLVE